MTFLYMARTGVSLFAACLFVSIYAIAPEWQRVPKGVGKLDSVVRVYGDDGAGTGSVIAKIPDPFDQNYYLLCVLTANHVVWDDGYYNRNLKVGFHNKGADNALDYSAWIVGEGRFKNIEVNNEQTRPDLAVLGVRVPKMEFFNRLRPLSLDSDRPTGAGFSVVGYGVTADRFDKDGDGNWDGYLHDRSNPAHDYGLKRFANNRIRNPKVWVEDNKWKYWAMEWNLLAIGPGVGGHGNAWVGDSGGPYLVYDPWTITVKPPHPHNPEDVDVFTDKIIGVHTLGETAWFGDDWPNRGDPPRFMKKNIGFKSWGVPMFAEYREWIEMECMNVPEPASMTALLVGTLYVLARRRRKSKA